MKIFKILLLTTIVVIVIQACGEGAPPEMEKVNMHNEFANQFDTTVNIDTRGYQGNGEIYKEWDCPDSKFFSPIDLKAWEKTPAVNGRMPTYKETITGVAIHTYGGDENPDVKPYNMLLPRLAYKRSEYTGQEQVVVVIQIVQTKTDTIVGYRYLSGGVGGSRYRDFRFLTEEEVRKTVEDWKNMKITPKANKC